MPETNLQKLKKLNNELGSPGVEALWKASQKRGIGVTKAQVRDLLQSSGAKQIFGKLQPADGKTVSRGLDDSWQMDLADLKNQPAIRKDKTYKFFLVVVNTFDRVVYTRALKTKEPSDVKIKIAQILSEAPKKPKVISSDNGSEFLTEVSVFFGKQRHRTTIQTSRGYERFGCG